MLCRRVIACLDVDEGRVVKGRQFVDLREVGDPVELALRHQDDGADEIVFLDISATIEGRGAVYETIRRAAASLSVPLTVGGGVGSVADVDRLLRAGADKVAINSAAVSDPSLLTAAAQHFGCQCVVASIDAAGGLAGQVRTHGGRRTTDRRPLAWALECAERGAGEILLTSIDCDGRGLGFDIDLTGRIRAAVGVPVIASGGAGSAQHFVDVFQEASADAALAAGIFHRGTVSIAEVKRAMVAAGVPTRSDDCAVAPVVNAGELRS